MLLTFDVSLLLPALVFLAVAGSLLAAGGLFHSQESRLARRMRELPGNERRAANLRRRGVVAILVPRVHELTEIFLPNDQATRTRLQRQLFQAGIYSPGALRTYFASKLALMTISPLACLALGWFQVISLGTAVGAGCVVSVVGVFLPGLWLRQRRAARHVVLRRSLPDFLDLVVTCLEGGLSMNAALKQVTEELRLAHPLLAAELTIVLHEMELGRSLEAGLAHLAERTGLDELRTLCTFVQQTVKFGTTMGDAMRQLGDMLRVQREQRAEELAQKAAVKILFPTLLFIFPVVFVVLAGPAAIQIKEGLTDSTKQAALVMGQH